MVRSGRVNGNTIVPVNRGPAVGTTGGLGHNNLMPLLGLNFCISLGGIFPSRN